MEDGCIGGGIALDFPNWVDVRDVAKVHVSALQCSEARGQRFILTNSKEGVTYSGVSIGICFVWSSADAGSLPRLGRSIFLL